MAVQPKPYRDLYGFFMWWHEHFSKTKNPEKFVDSLNSGSIGVDEARRCVENTQFHDHLTAFRRLRQDARLRVVKRFFGEISTRSPSGSRSSSTAHG